LSTYINYNGSFRDPNLPIATTYNRSLRYGDGLFETMLWDGYRIQNQVFHLDRLFGGLKILQFDLSSGFSRSFISQEIQRLCEQNSPGIESRVRLNVFREDGPFLLPMQNKPLFVIETSPLIDQNPNPLRLSLYKAETKPTGILGNLKTNNYLLNILALQYAKGNGYDDALILNSRGNICEASSSNLFMIQKGILFTPALTQGCVAGTKRRELLERLPGLGFQIEETIITKEMIYEMEEVFLTNAIQEIRPVICIDHTYYTRELTMTLSRILKGSQP